MNSKDFFYNLLIFFPIITTINLIFLMALNLFKGKELLDSSWFSFDDKSLIVQKPFWISIISVLVLSYVFSVICWDDTGFFDGILELSKRNDTKNLSRIPIYILASIFPILAIIIAAHKTVQTNSQIKQAESKHNIDLFYAHKKDWIEHFDGFHFLPKHRDFPISINSGAKCYSSAFESSSPRAGIPKLKTTKIKNQIEKLIYLRDELLNSRVKYSNEYSSRELKRRFNDSQSKYKKLLSLLTEEYDLEDIHYHGVDDMFEYGVWDFLSLFERVSSYLEGSNELIKLIKDKEEEEHFRKEDVISLYHDCYNRMETERKAKEFASFINSMTKDKSN